MFLPRGGKFTSYGAGSEEEEDEEEDAEGGDEDIGGVVRVRKC